MNTRRLFPIVATVMLLLILTACNIELGELLDTFNEIAVNDERDTSDQENREDGEGTKDGGNTEQDFKHSDQNQESPDESSDVQENIANDEEQRSIPELHAEQFQHPENEIITRLEYDLQQTATNNVIIHSFSGDEQIIAVYSTNPNRLIDYILFKPHGLRFIELETFTNPDYGNALAILSQYSNVEPTLVVLPNEQLIQLNIADIHDGIISMRFEDVTGNGYADIVTEEIDDANTESMANPALEEVVYQWETTQQQYIRQ